MEFNKELLFNKRKEKTDTYIALYQHNEKRTTREI